MINLIIGTIWTIFALLIGYITFTKETSVPVEIIVFLAFLVFGIFLLIKGIKKLIQNQKTEKLGEECYAMVDSIYPTGTRVNNAPEYKANFLVYIPSQNKVEKISEVIGFNPLKYPIQSFVKGKFYENDINIKETVEYNNLPLNIRQKFDYYRRDNSIDTDNNILSEDIITINGVKYKKIENQDQK